MALIACPECAREISDKAATCPHCGNPMNRAVVTAPAPPAPPPAPKGEGCFLQTLNFGCLIVVLIIILTVIGSCIGTSKDPMRRSSVPDYVNMSKIV